MPGSRVAMARAAFAVFLVTSGLAQAQTLPTATEAAAPVADVDADRAARVAVVQRHVDAYRSGNLDRFVATFTSDAQVFALGLAATGHKEIRALYRLNFGPDAPSIRIVSSEVNDNFVFLEAAYVMKNGDEICCSYSEYEVRDGKISYLAASAP